MTHLECAYCQAEFPSGEVHGLCTKCNRPLWVRYDLELIRREFPKKKLFGRPPTLWRYLELLPVEDPQNIVSLTETITPILPVDRLGSEFGLQNLMIKDESRLPTGSFKAPMIFNPYFEKEGIDTLVVPMGCKGEDFPEFFKSLFQL